MKTAAVVACRNDHYGNNLFHRAKMCLSSLAECFDVVYYIDWKTREIPLTQEIKQLDNYNNIITVSVPKDVITNKYGHLISSLLTREYLAKNIGIRLAIQDKAEWICSTNIDIIIDNLQIDELDEQTLYTARRNNIPKEFHMQYNLFKGLLRDMSAKKHLFPKSPYLLPKHKQEQASEHFLKEAYVIDYPDEWSLVSNCGDFQLATAGVWNSIRGFEETAIGTKFTDTNLMKKAVLNGFKIDTLNSVDVYHLDHDRDVYPNKDDISMDYINDMDKCIRNFSTSTNTPEWGLI